MEQGFRSACVYVRGTLAGTLRETDAGYEFEYDPVYRKDDALPAVSLTLPKQEEPYRSKTLFPFFDGLIPEGWLLDLVAHNWKLDPRDRFGLLQVACRDCVGAVHIGEVSP